MEAHFENRIYFFDIISKDKNEVVVELYKMTYTFVKVDGRWRNHVNNRMVMRQELLEVIVGLVL
ncbi:MAG TPA: hypothetical protein VGB84_06250 [Arachidicoccus sp.]